MNQGTLPRIAALLLERIAALQEQRRSHSVRLCAEEGVRSHSCVRVTHALEKECGYALDSSA